MATWSQPHGTWWSGSNGIQARSRRPVIFPNLDATISCRIKKALVGVTQLLTALVSFHSSRPFLWIRTASLIHLVGRTVLFSVDDCSLFPVDCMIGLIRVVGEC